MPDAAPSPFGPGGGAVASASIAGNAGDAQSGALTYQVYAPDALPSQRSMPSLASASFQVAPQKPSVALRVCLVLVGVCVVVGTAALIIAGSSDDSPRAAKAEGAAASASASALALVSPSSPSSAPVAPAAVEPPAGSVAVAAPPPDPPAAPVKPTKGTKAKAAGSSAAGLRGVALPPNPFGGGAGGGSAKPATKKK